MKNMRIAIVIITLALILKGCGGLNPTVEVIDYPKSMNVGQWYSFKFQLTCDGDDLPRNYKAYLDVSFTGSPSIKIASRSGWSQADLYPPGSTIWALHDDYTRPPYEIQSNNYLVSAIGNSLNEGDRKILEIAVKPNTKRNIRVYYRGTFIRNDGDERTSIKSPSNGPRDEQNHPSNVIDISVN